MSTPPALGTAIVITPDTDFDTELNGATALVVEHLAHGRVRAEVQGTFGWSGENLVLGADEYLRDNCL